MLYDFNVVKGPWARSVTYFTKDEARHAMMTEMYLLEPEIEYINHIDTIMRLAISGVAYTDSKGYIWICFELKHSPGAFLTQPAEMIQ